MFSSSNTTRKRIPPIPFKELALAILGANYDLSLAFVGDKKSRTLNQIYRKKTYTPNVLSFPLSKRAGEVVINPKEALKEAPHYGHSYKKHVALLFIHGCLHLKGYPHGATMDRTTRHLLRRFSLL